MATQDKTIPNEGIECRSEAEVRSAQGYSVHPGYPPQQTYVASEAPPAYKETLNIAQPPAVVTAPHTTGMIRQPTSEPVRDYTVFAVIVTVCFCVPFGIVGIIKASEAKSKRTAGDVEGARLSAQSAFRWSMSGLVCGIVFGLVVGIYFAVLQLRTVDFSSFST